MGQWRANGGQWGEGQLGEPMGANGEGQWEGANVGGNEGAQQGNKGPTDQRANEPTGQRANEPTGQQAKHSS